MFTFGGWDQLASMAEEVRSPNRTLPAVLIGGMVVVSILYTAFVVTLYAALPVATIRDSPAVGRDLFALVFGSAGATAASVLIGTSALVAANGAMMSGPRVFFAVARDGLGPRWLGRAGGDSGTPTAAIAVMGAAATVLVLLLSAPRLLLENHMLPARAFLPLLRADPFGSIVNVATFAYLISLCGMLTSMIALRYAKRDAVGTFRVLFFPFTPITT